MKIKIPSHLDDAELTAELKRIVCDERGMTVSAVAHLMVFEARRLYLGAGFPSLYAYCREILRLSEYESYHRIKAARAARRFPVILEKLAEASLTLTTVRLVAPHLTEENHQELIGLASGKSKREVEALLARLFPEDDVPDTVRNVPSPTVTPPSRIAPPSESPGWILGELVGETAAAGSPFISSVPLPAPAPPPRRSLVRPLASGDFEVLFTASAGTYEKLEFARDMLGHAVPDGDTSEIIDRALTVLLEDLARKKFAYTEHPRPSRGHADDSPYIPAAVKREVWLRDGGRCAFVSADGRRCGERHCVEFHHVIPRAAGGKATVENVSLRCRGHNAHEADLYYGPREPDRGDDYVREPSAPWQLTEGATGPGASSRSARSVSAVVGNRAVLTAGYGSTGPRSGSSV